MGVARLFSDCLQRIEMPLRHRILVAGLRYFYTGLVQFFPRQSSLLIELLPALVNLFLRVQRLLRLRARQH